MKALVCLATATVMMILMINGGSKMKKLFLIFAAFAAMVACSKEPVAHIDDAEPAAEGLTFIASVGETFTKTTLSDVGGGLYDVVWATSDQIRITDGTNDAVYKPTAAASQSPLSKYLGTEPTGPTFYAYYPSDFFNTTTRDFTLPGTRESYTSGAFVGFPMYAQSDNSDLQFKNVCGFLQLSLSGTTSDKIGRVVVSANEYLAGPMTITEDSGAYKASLSSGSKQVSVAFSSYKTLTEGVVVNIPLPAGTYTGLTIEVYSNPAGPYYAQKVANKGIVIARSQITPITLTTIAFNKTALAKGAGTSGDPFQIETEADLIALGNACRKGLSYSGKYLKVMSNITLTGAHVPFALTCNTFDGNGKTITLSGGFNFSSKPTYGGFFSEFSGTLKDLTMAGADVSLSTTDTENMQAFGALVGSWQTKSGTVSGCSNSINVELSSSTSAQILVGGLLGIYYGTIDNCHNTGNLTVNSTVRSQISSIGGVVGKSGYVSTSTNTGSITATNVRYCGGVSGYMGGEGLGYYVNKCKNTGAVSSTTLIGASSASNRVRAGGIAGYCANPIEARNCFNSGSITAWGPIVYWPGSIAGGIFGETKNSPIKNCYNLGDITAKVGRALTDNGTYTCKPLAGGISGFNGTVTNCYSAGTLTTMRSITTGTGWQYGRCEGGIISMIDYSNSAFQGSASFCYYPDAKLDESAYDLFCIGYKTREQKEDYYQDNTSTARGNSGTDCSSFNTATLVTGGNKSGVVTINAVEYPVGTSILTLLNAERDVLGSSTYLAWKAGAGDPAYPVFDE